MGLWIKPNRRVNFDAFEIGLGIADVTESFLGWMSWKNEFSGVRDD